MSEVDGAATATGIDAVAAGTGAEAETAAAPAHGDRVTSALMLVAEMFAAVCHAPDDEETATRADKSLRDLDAMFARDLDALLAEPARVAA